MKQPLQLLLFAVLLVALLGALVVMHSGLLTPAPAPKPVAPVAPAKPVAPIMPSPSPSPIIRPKLFLFTQPGCPPCARMKIVLSDPSLADELSRFDYQEIGPADPLWRAHRIQVTPTLIAIDSHLGVKSHKGLMTLTELKDWLGSVQEVIEKISEGGPVAPDGKTEVATDLPVELRHHNVGGRDGAGCCPFASVQHSARYQNERRLWNFLEDVAKHEAGGGWPEKMDKMMAKYAPGVQYVQYIGKDPSILELALKTGRMPAITYNGRDVHYRGPIAHMVSLVYLDANWACILDNNYIGANQLVWMLRPELLARWCGGGNGWAVVILSGRPPAPPRN